MSASDPIIAAIRCWNTANDAFLAAHRRAQAKWPQDPVRAEEVANRATWATRDRALRALYATAPTTFAGLAALARVFQAEECEAFEPGPAGDGLRNILRSAARLAAEAEERGSRVTTREAARTASRRKPPAGLVGASA